MPEKNSTRAICPSGSEAVAVRFIGRGRRERSPWTRGLVRVTDGGAFAPCTVTLTVADEALVPAVSYATARRL